MASGGGGPEDGAGTSGTAGLPRRGSFAQTDVLKYRRAFDSADHLRNGTIAPEDLQGAVTRLGYRITHQHLQDILANNNISTSDRITFEQFLDIIPRNNDQISSDEHRLAELREKFQRYDVDRNGVISLQEATWALQAELKVTPQTALRMLNQFVKLNYEQFVEFYQQVQDKKLEMYEKFGRYDMDKDGLVSVEEAHAVLHDELGFTPERSRAMVERFDTNQDGRVSYMEFAEFYMAVEERKDKIRSMFQRFDPDREGYVSYENAEEILEGMFGFSPEKSRQIIETYDTKKDGKIDYEEFLDFYSMLEEERERLLAEFNRFDTDHDGRISYEEFHSMLLQKGYTDRQAEGLMAGYDRNHDGYLDFNEFKRYLNFS